MKVKKLITFLITVLFTAILAFTTISTVFAIIISPATFEYTVSPGETVEDSITLTNNENSPKFLKAYLNDTYILARNQTKQYTDEAQPRGIINWTTILEDPTQVNPGEEFTFNFIIRIPKGAEPGTYSGAIMGSAFEDLETAGSAVGLAPRAAGTMNITVEGDFEEKLSGENFTIDPLKKEQGSIVFVFEAKNEGNVKIAPIGEIKIYDKQGNMVPGVYAVVKEFENEKVITDRLDVIPFNPGNESILPSVTRGINTGWENRNVEPGEYKAKLNLYYGQDNTKIELETDMFEIEENFQLADLAADSAFKSSLPITFSAKLKNQGSVDLSPTGSFSIKNIFGMEKKRVDLSADELKIKGGEEKTINNLTWDTGFAFGIYSANLELRVGDQTYIATTTFWILSWWQVLITIIVVLVIIFALYKGIHGYLAMKKKLETKESIEGTPKETTE
ncbi:hypothetical protein ACFLZH_00740 [Patescibacteria group bacterium]